MLLTLGLVDGRLYLQNFKGRKKQMFKTIFSQ